MTYTESAINAATDVAAMANVGHREQERERRAELRRSAEFCLAGASIFWTLGAVVSLAWFLAALLSCLGNPSWAELRLLLAPAGTLGTSLFFAGAAKWMRSMPHA